MHILDILQGVSDISVNVGDAVQALIVFLGGVLAHKTKVAKDEAAKK